MKGVVLKYYKDIRKYIIINNTKGGKMNYKKTALQLFEELSCLYTDDICKHINLCRRYPILANEWEQKIIAYLDDIQKSENCDENEAEERKKKLYEKITGKKWRVSDYEI